MRIRRRDGVLYAIGLLISGVTILRGIGPHDEGLMLQAGVRVAGGQWPYRDFWTNYGPGQPVLLAGLVKVFGSGLLPWRVVRVLLDALIGVLVYRLVRRERDEGLSLLAWVAAITAMAWPTGPGPNPMALALGLGAVLAARRSPVGAGALVGVAAVFRPEIAAACAIGALMGSPTGTRWRLAGIAAGVAAVLLAPFAIVAGSRMWDQTIGFFGRQSLQRLPLFPAYSNGLDPNKLLEWAFPALLLAFATLWVVWWFVRRPPAPAVALAPLALVGVAYLLGRTDPFHLVPLSLALTGLLAVSAAREWPGPWKWALVMALGVIALHGVERRAGELLHPPALAAVPGGVGDGVRTDPADARALSALLPRVRALTPGGQSIIVLPPRTDRVTVGDPLLYVLARRPNPTRYDVMQPGVVTTAGAQREMIADLQRARTPVLVRWLDPRTAPEDNGSGRQRGSQMLDTYLRAAYRPLARYGNYVLYVRRA